MIKRSFDLFFSIFLLIVLSPILLIFSFLIWKQDFSSPFYISKRVGKGEKEFNFFKFRSMIVNADSTGVVSTSSNDNRITPLGKIIRKYKIDELPQLANVLLGHMSIVGPRPNVINDVKIYTSKEKNLLNVRPGITDFSSIIFSDEGEILADSDNPDLKYNQIIRPWKSRLGLFYINKNNLFIDVSLIFLTIVAIFNRQYVLEKISILLSNLGAKKDLIEISKRNVELKPHFPPGSKKIVTER
jgi:lipopolysaccharide/colanic/teichoic acid biosynthesis glycosyltransferase